MYINQKYIFSKVGLNFRILKYHLTQIYTKFLFVLKDNNNVIFMYKNIIIML